MKIIISFRSRQRRMKVKYMCRTERIESDKLNPIELFHQVMAANRDKIPSGLEISGLKRLQVGIYKISYWSALGLITIRMPFLGNVRNLPPFAKKSNGHYLIKYHTWYRVSTVRTSIVRNGRVLLLTKRIYPLHRRRFF